MKNSLNTWDHTPTENLVEAIKAENSDAIIKFERVKNVDPPRFGTSEAAGFDLQTAEDVLIFPRESKLVSLGIAANIPDGWYIKICPRGSTWKKGVRIANSPGTIDSDYTGEWFVILQNVTSEAVIIPSGSWICQGILSKRYTPYFIEHVSLDKKTERGDGCLGSTDNFLSEKGMAERYKK